MLASEAAQDAIAQNLANAGTTGYKRDIPRFQSFQALLVQRMANGQGIPLGSLGHGSRISGFATDFDQGTLQKTDNPLDIALTGDAALAVQTAQGTFLSRDGALTRNSQGQLVQADSGSLVLGQSGQPIRIPLKAKDITISPQGDITADGMRVGRLRLLDLSPAAQPVIVGDNEFAAAAFRPASPTATVQQGYLESSNVSVVKEMVAMITVQRAYETDQKMLQAEDQVTGKATNDIGKV